MENHSFKKWCTPKVSSIIDYFRWNISSRIYLHRISQRITWCNRLQSRGIRGRMVLLMSSGRSMFDKTTFLDPKTCYQESPL